MQLWGLVEECAPGADPAVGGQAAGKERRLCSGGKTATPAGTREHPSTSDEWELMCVSHHH